MALGKPLKGGGGAILIPKKVGPPYTSNPGSATADKVHTVHGNTEKVSNVTVCSQNQLSLGNWKYYGFARIICIQVEGTLDKKIVL